MTELNDNEMGMYFTLSAAKKGFWLQNEGYKAKQRIESKPSYFEVDVTCSLSSAYITLTPRGEKRLAQLEAKMFGGVNV